MRRESQHWKHLISWMLIIVFCLPLLPLRSYALDEETYSVGSASDLESSMDEGFVEPEAPEVPDEFQEETALENRESVESLKSALDFDENSGNALGLEEDPGDALDFEENSGNALDFEGNQEAQETGLDSEPPEEISSDFNEFPDPLQESDLPSVEEMPADYDCAESWDHAFVSASWADGIFPAGTKLQLDSLGSAEAEAIGKLALGDDCNLTGAFAVDITFENLDYEEELQPADFRNVSITLDLPEKLLGDTFYLVHCLDNGQLEFVTGAVVSVERLDNGSMLACKVFFDASSFSVYALLAEGQVGREARRSYHFYVNGELFFSQSVTNTDTLGNPGIPNVGMNEEFGGWYRTDDPNKAVVTIDELREELESAEIYEGQVISLTARILQTHTLTFLNEDQEVIKTVKIYDGESYTVTESLQIEGSESVFRGWSLDGKSVSAGETINDISTDLVLKPVIHRLFSLTFHPDCGDENGWILPPVAAEEGTELISWLPGREVMVRQGYEFAGWYRGREENGVVTLEGDQVVDGTVTEDETFYARWIPAEETAFTVKIWKQSVEDDYRIGLSSDSPYYDESNDLSSSQKTYVFDRSVRLQGITGAEVFSAEGYTELLTPDTGFCFSKSEVQNGDGAESDRIDASGGTLVNLYFDRQIMALTCADVEVREFVENSEQLVNVYGTDGTSWFPVYGIETDGYVEVPETVAEDNKKYYGTEDGLNFFRIWYSENATSFTESSADGANYRLSDDGRNYVRVYLVDGVWRQKKSSDGEEYNGVRYKAGGAKELWIKSSDSTCSVAYYGARYIQGKTLAWFRENSSEGEPYNGTRFVRSTHEQDIVFTGLYGQSFEKYHYAWPQDYVPAESSFKDEFTGTDIFSETVGNGAVRTGTLNPVQGSSETEKITVHIHARNAAGDYEERTVYSCYPDSPSGCYVSNTLSGFRLSEFAWSDDPDSPEGAESWSTAEARADGTVWCEGNGDHLHLRYEPVLCRLVFRDGFRQGEEGIFKALSLPFGDLLSKYQAQLSGEPLREGYAFTGWFLDPYGTEPFLWKGNITSDEITVFAGWEKRSYRVVVDLCDDSSSPAEYSPGRSFLLQDSETLPDSIPSRPGYQFLGYYTDSELSDEFLLSNGINGTLSAIDLEYPGSEEYREGLEKDGDLIHEAEREEDYVSGKLQLYVGWKKLIRTSLFLQYDANGGDDAPADQEDYFGQEYVTAHGICTPPGGMGFLCWTYTDAETGEEVEVYPGHAFLVGRADMSVEENDDRTICYVTLKAKYVKKQIPEVVLVTFAANGGGEDYCISVAPNEDFVIPDALTAGVARVGYRLIGWNTEDDGSGECFFPGETVAANSHGSNTLYAEWEKISYTVSFCLNHEESGTAPNDQQVLFGETAEKPEDPVRPGYRFEGWTKDGAGYDFTSPVRESFTLVAQWVREYSVTYRVFSDSGIELEGAPVEDRGYLPGETVQLKPEPQPVAGYQLFSGWDIDGGLIDDQHFTMPEENVTVHGSFTPIRYSVQYDLGGGIVTEANPASYTVEDGDWTLNSPVRTGYIFLGWTVADGGEPRKDLVVRHGSTGDLHYSAVWEPFTHTRYTVTVHYPDDWELPAEIPNATVDQDLKTVFYECYGTTDTMVTAQAFQNPDDRRLVCDENHEGSLLRSAVLPDGSLSLHVFLKRVEYHYELEYYLKGSERILSTCSGVVRPDENGEAIVEASLDDITLGEPYSDYSARLAIDGSSVQTLTRDDAVIRIPVTITVSIDRMDTMESYNNGEEQQGYSYSSLAGTSFISTSADQHLVVSGLLPGDSMSIDMVPAKGKDPDTYQATFGKVTFSHGGSPVSYYTFTGFDPKTMGQLSILSTLTVKWMNGDDILLIDPYVQPDTVPVYRGDTPRMPSDSRFDYVFNGWKPAPGPLKRDSEFSADFRKTYRSYTITWMDEDGALLREDSLQYGETPIFGGVSPEKPEDKEYTYRFTGWDPAVSEVSGDAEYRAIYDRTPKKYHITYYIDGEQSGDSLTVPYGEEISLRPNPTKDGFTFSGWTSSEVAPDNGKFVMPAENVTFSGQFVPVPKEDFNAEQLSDAEKPRGKNGLRYTGEDQALITADWEIPEAFSRVLFSLDDGKTWSEQIPTGKNAGDYTILAEYSGSSRYNDLQLAPIVVSIGKGEIPSFRISVYAESTYNGMEQNLLSTVPELPEELSIEYKVLTSEGITVSDWSVSEPTVLEPGRYQVYYRIDGGDNYIPIEETWADNGRESFAVIIKAEQTRPSTKPRVHSDAPGTITITQPVHGQQYLVMPKGETPSDEDWSAALLVSESLESLRVGQLTPGQEIVVFTRKAGNNFYNPSGFIASDSVQVLKEPQESPTSAVSTSAGRTTITVKPAYADQEYRLEGIGDWTAVPEGENELTFTGLTPDTDYWILTRMAETATKAASEPGNSMKVHTAAEGLFTEIRGQSSVFPAISADDLTTGFANGLLTPEDKAQLTKGNSFTVFLQIKDMNDTASAAEKALVTKKAESLGESPVIWAYLDISLMKQLEGKAPVPITELVDQSLEITFTMPDSALNTDAAVKRSFSIVTVHNGSAEILTPVVSGSTLKFYADSFSTYAFIYVDQKVENKTNDESEPASGTATISSGSGGTGTTVTPQAAAVSLGGTSSANSSKAADRAGDSSAMDKPVDAQPGEGSSKGGQNIPEPDLERQQVSPDTDEYSSPKAGKRIGITPYVIPLFFLLLLLLFLGRKRKNKKEHTEAERTQSIENGPDSGSVDENRVP